MGRPAKYDDDELLDRAMTLFWERGWAETSIRDLEEALDLKAPSIYRRFGSKEGLGVAAVEHYVDRVVARRVAKHLSGKGDPLDNLARFLRSSVTQSRADQQLRGCLLTTLGSETSDRDDALRAALAGGRRRIDRGLRREVDRAAASGLLRAGVEPGAAASMLALAMQGLMASARAGVSAATLQRRAVDAVSLLAAEPRERPQP